MKLNLCCVLNKSFVIQFFYKDFEVTVYRSITRKWGNRGIVELRYKGYFNNYTLNEEDIFFNSLRRVIIKLSELNKKNLHNVFNKSAEQFEQFINELFL